MARSGWLTRAFLVGAGLGFGFAAAQRLREADLSGQVVLVTGGSRGLGLLLAREFARNGCRIAVCGRDREQLERAGADLRRLTPEVLTVRCDVSDRSQVDGLVNQVLVRFGRIDVLVNNAGIIQVGPMQDMSLQDFEQAMNAMFWGPVYTTLAVLPAMRKRRSGRIVNITSIGGVVSVPHLLPYNAAKFAALGFSEGLHAEAAKDGVRVTTVVPGLMRTGSQEHARFKGDAGKEYRLFAPLASLPLVAADAERMAHRIVTATRRGEAEVILSPQANLLARVHGLFPGTTSNVLGVVNRVLPGPHGPNGGAVSGREVEAQGASRWFELITRLGRSAARRFLQQPPEPPPTPAPGEPRPLRASD